MGRFVLRSQSVQPWDPLHCEPELWRSVIRKCVVSVWTAFSGGEHDPHSGHVPHLGAEYSMWPNCHSTWKLQQANETRAAAGGPGQTSTMHRKEVRPSTSDSVQAWAAPVRLSGAHREDIRRQLQEHGGDTCPEAPACSPRSRTSSGRTPAAANIIQRTPKNVRSDRWAGGSGQPGRPAASINGCSTVLVQDQGSWRRRQPSPLELADPDIPYSVLACRRARAVRAGQPDDWPRRRAPGWPGRRRGGTACWWICRR